MGVRSEDWDPNIINDEGRQGAVAEPAEEKRMDSEERRRTMERSERWAKTNPEEELQGLHDQYESMMASMRA